MGKRKRSPDDEDSHPIKEWIRDDITKLIRTIHENEFLWNPKHEDFHKKQKRTDKIDEIVVLLENKYTNGDIRFKWRNLRNYFSGEVSKERYGKRTGNGMVSAYQSSWEFYKSMEFVRDVMVVPENNGNFPNDFKHTSIAVAAIEHLGTDYACGNFGGQNDKAEDPELQTYINELLSVKKSDSGFSTSGGGTTSLSRKPLAVRRAVKKKDQKNLDAKNSNNNISFDQSNAATNPNEAFGRHVALSLEALPAYSQAWVKFEIQKILFRAVCGPQTSSSSVNETHVNVMGQGSPPVAAGATAIVSQQQFLSPSRFQHGGFESLEHHLPGSNMQMN